MLLYLWNSKILSQSGVRVFGGANVTVLSVKYKEFSSALDTQYTLDRPIVLPWLGIDIDFDLNERFKCSSGIGISIMGSKNYSKGIIVVPGVNIHPDLQVGFIRIPCYISYDLKIASITMGYSLNYSFRKNQNFFASDSLRFVNIYSDFQHAAIVGIRKDWNLISIAVNYHCPLNPISNTKDFYPQWTEKQKLYGWQMSIGFVLRESRKIKERV